MFRPPSLSHDSCVLSRRVGWVGTVFTLVTRAFLCVSGIINMDVVTPMDLDRLIEAMERNDTRGMFNITWYGRQQIHGRIEVSDMKHVMITGVHFRGTDPVAANDAGEATGLFYVDGASTLNLRSLVLDGGRSQKGGAINVVHDSVVNVFDCAFTHNNASNGGDTSLRAGCCQR